MTEPLTADRGRPRHRAAWLLVAAVTALVVIGSGAAGAAALMLRHHAAGGPAPFGPALPAHPPARPAVSHTQR